MWWVWIILLLIGFWYLSHENFGGYCSNCGYHDGFSCGTCINCGYCLTPDGVGECIPGDQRGPYFRSDCQGWRYGIPLSYVGPVTVSTWPNIWVGPGYRRLRRRMWQARHKK